MKIFICLISLFGVSSATFGKLSLLGGGGLNSLLGSGAGGLFGNSLGSGHGGGGGRTATVEENYISIVDQLGPGEVIDSGVLRKRVPKSGNNDVTGGAVGGPVGGGAYNAGGAFSDAQHGQFIKVIDEGSNPGTIVNVYGDASGGFGGVATGSHTGYAAGDSGAGGVTVIRVIHEHAGASGRNYGSGYGGSGSVESSGAVKVYKIIENTSYGGADNGYSNGFSSTASSGGYSKSGSSGWAPISGKSGW